MRERRRVWLSVDWDFFQEERLEWDWSHKENPLYTHFLWNQRMFHRGTDIRPLTSPNLHQPFANTFWTRFAGQAGVDVVGVSDSHATGLPFFYQRRDSVPHEIWNFDAHHDLGYAPLSTLRSYVRAGKAEAGSWLYVLMKELPKLRCVHVYPTWKDPTVEQSPWRRDKAIVRRVKQVSATKFDWKQVRDVDIVGVLIAKSEAWSPPWNDEAFGRFVDDARSAFGAVRPYGNTDARDEREFDSDAARSFQDQIDAFRTRDRTRHRVTDE